MPRTPLFAPASTQITPETAPTAVPATIGAATYSKENVANLNKLLINLLSKSGKLSAERFYEKEQRLSEETLRRAGAEPTGEERFLSPGQQAQIRGARVGATEAELTGTVAQRRELERKIEGFPKFLTAFSDFAEKMKEKGEEYISHTFKEDPTGNVTWVGITEDGKVIQKNVGQIGKGFVGTGGGGGGAGFADVATTLKNVGIPSNVATSKGKLQKSMISKLVEAGISSANIDILWDAIISGLSFDEIRRNLLAQVGDRSRAFGLLDIFVQTLQGEEVGGTTGMSDEEFMEALRTGVPPKKGTP